MSNIRKQFNFRNGVQVDDDKFIVSSTGLVGIGTTIPTESLDLYGNAKISGFATATELRAQTLVVSQTATIKNITFNNSIIGSGVSIRSGVITATNSSGIVTYFGDARFLQGMPTSQWIDVDVGLGFTSIYAAGFVGVGTVDPRFVFQVAGNTDTTVAGFKNGVGISSSGDILATGITTSGKFVGIGSDLTLLNASNISSGTIDSNRLPTISDSKLDPNLNLGIVTATTFVGTLSGTATTALGLSGTPNIIVGILTASVVAASSFIGGITGNVVGNLTGTATTATSLTPTADVDIADLTVGVATISTRLYAESIGVGTNSPSSDIHIRRSSTSTLQVTSDSAAAIVAVGRSTTLDGNNSALIFGNTAGIYPYSLGGNSLDVVNYGTGNLNAYLDYGTAGVGTGSFNWIYGQDPTDTLMSLTYQGNLGLGVTVPSNTLHVVGTSTITGNAFFGQNINVSGNTNISGNLNLLGGGSLSANLTGNVSGNVNSTVGFSTFNNINVTNNVSSFKSFIGIGTTGSDPSYHFQVLDKFIVSSSGIGIGTDVEIPIIDSNFTISASNTDAVFNRVGIGTTVPQAALTVVGGTIISGVTTSLSGFTSQLFGNPVKIAISGSILTFTVPGVGATSLTLF